MRVRRDYDDDTDDDDDLDIVKRKRRRVQQGFWASVLDRLLHGLLARLIGVGVAICVFGGLCLFGVVASRFAGPPAPFLGEWDSTTTKVIQPVDGGVGEPQPEATLILDKDPEGGFGTFINEKGEEYDFTWSGHDKDRKTVVFIMDMPGDTFWRGIPSPATFTYAVDGDRLTLTSGKETITFQKVH